MTIESPFECPRRMAEGEPPHPYDALRRAACPLGPRQRLSGPGLRFPGHHRPRPHGQRRCPRCPGAQSDPRHRVRLRQSLRRAQLSRRRPRPARDVPDAGHRATSRPSSMRSTARAERQSSPIRYLVRPEPQGTWRSWRTIWASRCSTRPAIAGSAGERPPCTGTSCYAHARPSSASRSTMPTRRRETPSRAG